MEMMMMAMMVIVTVHSSVSVELCEWAREEELIYMAKEEHPNKIQKRGTKRQNNKVLLLNLRGAI